MSPPNAFASSSLRVFDAHRASRASARLDKWLSLTRGGGPSPYPDPDAVGINEDRPIPRGVERRNSSLCKTLDHRSRGVAEHVSFAGTEDHRSRVDGVDEDTAARCRTAVVSSLQDNVRAERPQRGDQRALDLATDVARQDDRDIPV